MIRKTEAVEPVCADEALASHLALLSATAGPDTPRAPAAAGMLLLWLADEVASRVNASLQAHDITESKLHVLMLFSLAERGLVKLGTITPSMIAETFGVTRSSATGLLDWLEARGLLARETCVGDRRSLELVMTDRGRALLDSAMPTFWRACADCTGVFDEQDSADLQHLLSKLWRALAMRRA
ncbi:MarR family transcriptional regulator [Burkholderia sp. FERM BP-3421]|jgi:DNA-binding MarR family transcriptional regulator|uniref:MarR family winged helix-turn-helix transcriptional regulator n=1 Tax=Burkholderia sp. FERM BP-3421 TaxID=1494466 RepID=UPI002361727A|nr:MarR family transcriptional regulator [Burkholderia sp. FERM BP-3421]WDD92260.1 MarR family transcriptional regulator [Burkholderia sp. FERM BP-3421]